MIADVVTLDEVLAAAGLKRASLVPETSGYLALAVGDATERLPFRLEDRAVTLTTEGSIGVARGTEIVSEQESASRLRDMLKRLLEASAGSMPGLDAAARARQGAGGVSDVVADIEAALIPVNRAAARRALARLARETLRAKQAGKLKRKRSAARAAAPLPGAPPEPVRPTTARADGHDVLNEASEPPPRFLQAPPAPAPVEAPAEPDDDIVVEWTAAPPTPAPVEAVVQPAVALAEPAPAPVEDLSWSPPTAQAAPVVALAVDILPSVEPSPCMPDVQAVISRESLRDSDLTPIGEPEAYDTPEDMTVFDPSVVPTMTCDPPPAAEVEPPPPAPAPPSAPIAIAAPPPRPVVAPAAPKARPKSRRSVPADAQLDDAPRSSVEDLLSSFGAPTDDRVIRAVAAGLKSLAGLEPTPPPPGTVTMKSPTPLPAVAAEPKTSPSLRQRPEAAPRAPASRGLTLPLLLLVLAVLVTIVAYRPDLLALSTRF